MTFRFQLLASLLVLGLISPPAAASFLSDRDARTFIDEMVRDYGFSRTDVEQALADARHLPRVIRLITPPASRGQPRSWRNYRARFLDPVRIDGGVAFWRSHRERLAQAERIYGVPAEIIVAILGVETVYGRNTGNFGTLSALATLAFDYPPRAALFRKELRELMLLAREQQQSLSHYRGSYAGALGYPQFLPSSIRNFAVDFDRDGDIDLVSDPIDAIGSIANYLSGHGWQPGAPIAERAISDDGRVAAELAERGILADISPDTFWRAGLRRADGGAALAEAALIDLETPGESTEYWFGYQNFYVITRYNRSSFYAMSVFQLAETIRHDMGTTGGP